MKVPLTTTIVKSLKLELKPAGYANGKLTYQPNPEGKEYILFCSHQDSPPGFGVKVAGKKTWVIQRRVSKTKVIKATVGNCADWPLETARERAADMGWAGCRCCGMLAAFCGFCGAPYVCIFTA